jgi:hypothetical protein
MHHSEKTVQDKLKILAIEINDKDESVFSEGFLEQVTDLLLSKEEANLIIACSLIEYELDKVNQHIQHLMYV